MWLPREVPTTRKNHDGAHRTHLARRDVNERTPSVSTGSRDRLCQASSASRAPARPNSLKGAAIATVTRKFAYASTRLAVGAPYEVDTPDNYQHYDLITALDEADPIDWDTAVLGLLRQDGKILYCEILTGAHPADATAALSDWAREQGFALAVEIDGVQR